MFSVGVYENRINDDQEFFRPRDVLVRASGNAICIYSSVKHASPQYRRASSQKEPMPHLQLVHV